ncbi:hypothetical protein [Rhizobium tubonense]|uniref:hypothetical protein n=1 Tax=Rhizobium tubonense TaxID=484088 RepID=UPI003B82ECDC
MKAGPFRFNFSKGGAGVPARPWTTSVPSKYPAKQPTKASEPMAVSIPSAVTVLDGSAPSAPIKNPISAPAAVPHIAST